VWLRVPGPATVWCLVARAEARDRVVCWRRGRGRQSPGDGGPVVGAPGRDRRGGGGCGGDESGDIGRQVVFAWRGRAPVRTAAGGGGGGESAEDCAGRATAEGT